MHTYAYTYLLDFLQMAIGFWQRTQTQRSDDEDQLTKEQEKYLASWEMGT